MRTVVLIVVAMVLVVFGLVLFISMHSPVETPAMVSRELPPHKPAVYVVLRAEPSGSDEEKLGARDYLSAVERRNLPDVIAGLNALCSEFYFTEDGTNAQYTLLFSVSEIDDVGVGLVDATGTIHTKRVHSIDSAYFTACGMLRSNGHPELKKKK